MEHYIAWTNRVANGFVELPVGLQMLSVIVLAVPVSYLLARYCILPPIDAVQRAYRRAVDPIPHPPAAEESPTSASATSTSVDTTVPPVAEEK